MKINQIPELTEDQKFEQFMREFAVLIADLHTTIEQKHKKIFNTFWNSSYDPQLIANTLGVKKATLLFQLSKTLQEIIKAGDEDYAPLQVWKKVEFTPDSVVISGDVV
jgi:hypothetical protein